jgi:hypothetical protein
VRLQCQLCQCFRGFSFREKDSLLGQVPCCPRVILECNLEKYPFDFDAFYISVMHCNSSLLVLNIFLSLLSIYGMYCTLTLSKCWVLSTVSLPYNVQGVSTKKLFQLHRQWLQYAKTRSARHKLTKVSNFAPGLSGSFDLVTVFAGTVLTFMVLCSF